MFDHLSFCCPHFCQACSICHQLKNKRKVCIINQEKLWQLPTTTTTNDALMKFMMMTRMRLHERVLELYTNAQNYPTDRFHLCKNFDRYFYFIILREHISYIFVSKNRWHSTYSPYLRHVIRRFKLHLRNWSPINLSHFIVIDHKTHWIAGFIGHIICDTIWFIAGD